MKVEARHALAAGCLLLALARFAAPTQAGETEERAKAYACQTFSPAMRGRCREIRAWSLTELRETPAATIADVFSVLASAAGMDPATIRLVGSNESELLAHGFGGGVYVLSMALRQSTDRCLIEGIAAHELAHETLGHIATRKVAGALSKLFTLGLATPAVKAFDRHQEEAADAEGQKILERAGATAVGGDLLAHEGLGGLRRYRRPHAPEDQRPHRAARPRAG